MDGHILMEHILLKIIMDGKKETEMVHARLLIILELEGINVQKQPIIHIEEKQKINTDIKVSFI